MIKGDIILIPFPFTDLTGFKNRPALILIANDDDVTVTFITTQLKWKDENDIKLEPNSENNLKKTSLIRLSKITTIDNDLVLGLLGKLTKIEIDELNNKLKILLKL